VNGIRLKRIATQQFNQRSRIGYTYVLSLSLARVSGTLFLPTSLQHLFCSLPENI